jgi:hypothetical protein
MSAPNRFSDQAGKSPGRLSHVTAAGLLAVAGGLHLAALPSHLNASTVAGAFFAITAAAQLLGAVLVVTRASARTIHAVVAGNVAVLVLWAMSRTTGLPTGGELGVREPFGLLDGMAAAAEILLVAAGLAIMIRAPKLIGRRHGSWRPALALVFAWMISGGAGLAVADGGHHHEGGHVHSGTASGGRSHHEPEVSQPVVPGPNLGSFDLGGPIRERSHDTPAASGQRHNVPAPDRVIIGSGCPAGHDCADHSH